MNIKMNQSTDLALINSLKKVNLPGSWNRVEFNKIITHFQEYSIENKQLKIPKKGLFIVAKLEDEAILFNHILSFFLAELYQQIEETSFYERVAKTDQIIPYNLSARELVLELLQTNKPHDLLLKYSSKKLLCITDFGKESVVKLPFYNSIDFFTELLNKRYRNHRSQKANTALYILNNCSLEELKKRYPTETFFYLKSLTDEIFLSET